jgi:GNAT superfamily N-acetyltransferase
MKRKTVFRDCKRSDLKALQELVEELYYTDAGPNADVPAISFTYRSLSAKPDKGRLVVFESGGELVGYAILIFFFSSEFGGDIIDIDEILVTEAARGKGVGNSFFEWISKTYKKAVGWSLQVRPGNKRARKLYESLGFLTSANLHLYNIFEWNDRHLLRGEAAKRKESSRKKTTTSKSAARKNSSKGAASGGKSSVQSSSRKRSRQTGSR